MTMYFASGRTVDIVHGKMHISESASNGVLPLVTYIVEGLASKVMIRGFFLILLLLQKNGTSSNMISMLGTHTVHHSS